MLIYIDLLILLNIWIDFLLLITTNLILKYKISYLRLFFASLVGGLSTFILFLNNIILSLLIKIVICIIMQLIVNGFKSMKSLIENVFYFYLVSIILAGFIYLFKDNISFKYNIIILGIITPFFLYISSKKIKDLNLYYKDRYDVIVFYKNKKYLFNGYLDTGNKLYDPYRKRPIILIYSNKIKFNYKEGLLIPIETANGESLLKCVKVKKIIIDNIEKENVLVGLSNNPFKIKDINMILHKDIIGG
ncbi:MAG: sigma-E processing peptidase SpoIIGA [Bacilli bacterium]|nr:sigma-E processing peptidase SpoIIGA [Bacilli bacterium]